MLSQTWKDFSVPCLHPPWNTCDTCTEQLILTSLIILLTHGSLENNYTVTDGGLYMYEIPRACQWRTFAESSSNLDEFQWCTQGPHSNLYCEGQQVPFLPQGYVDGSVQDCSNSSAYALELLQSCTKPSMCNMTDLFLALGSPSYVRYLHGFNIFLNNTDQSHPGARPLLEHNVICVAHFPILRNLCAADKNHEGGIQALLQGQMRWKSYWNI